VRQRYAHVKDYVKVTLIEVRTQYMHRSDLLKKFLIISSFMTCSVQANEILSSFDIGLRQYATNHLSKVT
jgi:NADH:ubiquinone reductase (non-electrogenic)